MAGKLLWGWDKTNKVWVPLSVDSLGRLKLDMTNISLNDLADVSVAAPADDDLFYYDDATSLWKSRKLVDADIPAGIARDSEVTAAVLAEAIARAADVDAEETARISADSAHAAATTGIHGAGSNHLALFGVASTVVTKFTPKSTATELWRRDDASDSSFEALINGAPTTTSVVYDNDLRENSLPDPTTRPQWGKVILHNITRGNSRNITDVNIATNTITTEASADDWADDDVITIGSQTCVSVGVYTYSRFFDIDISAEVPATAIAVLIEIFNNEQSGVGGAFANAFGGHPFETFGAAKTMHHFARAAYEYSTTYIVIPVISQKICGQIGYAGPISASNTIALMRLRGYWE